MRFVADMTNPETGKTYREENNSLQHRIPLNTLVETQWDDWFGEGACWKVHARLWVVAHRRDCDGTPLYVLSRWANFGQLELSNDCFYGFEEEQLTVIERTDSVRRGDDALHWPDK